MTGNLSYKSFRIYRANKQGNGVASQFQLSFKKGEKFDQNLLFLNMAAQKPSDDPENAAFDWDKSLAVKLGENDIGEIIAVLQGLQDQVGFKGSLFHETPSGGNKVIVFNRGENGFYLKVSGKDKEGKLIGPYAQNISNGEASVLLVLLRKAVETIYGWGD